MRISLFIPVFYLLGCGPMGEQNHIEDVPHSHGNRESLGSAFHSELGWRDTVAFYVHQDAPDHVADAAKLAAQTWNDAIQKPTIVYQGRTKIDRGQDLYSSLTDDAIVVYYESDWAATTGKSSVVLATTVWENSPENQAQIVKGDVILNAETYYFQNAEEEAPHFGAEHLVVDSETVLVHEFGHLLGLSHVMEDEDSVMQTYTAIGQGQHHRVLSTEDAENIREIYSPSP